MAEELDIDSFLNHKSRGSGGTFLTKWRAKDGPGWVDTWMHTQRMPIALWQHSLPKLFVLEDKKTKESSLVVWGGKHGCYEDESVLKNAWKKNEDGSRELPPLYCPLCRFLDTVRTMVVDGQLKWTQPLFRFVPDDPSKTQTIHAGGLYGSFGGDKLTDQQKEEMSRAKLSPMEAWKENATAKLNYVMCVVDNNNVSAGVQIAIETALLGDKVKEVINKSRKEFGADKGNPFTNPYAIQWEHKPQEKVFNKKYDATRMGEIQLTPAIAALIRGPAPDLTRVLAPFDIQEMRAYLERHCLVKNIPWDHIFDVRTREGSKVSEAQERPTPKEEKAREVQATHPVTTSAPDDDLVACDDCGTAMKETDPKCLKCGKVYIEEAPPPPPPPMRKRGAAAAVAKAPPPPPSSSHAASEQEQLDDDSIPF